MKSSVVTTAIKAQDFFQCTIISVMLIERCYVLVFCLGGSIIFVPVLQRLNDGE